MYYVRGQQFEKFKKSAINRSLFVDRRANKLSNNDTVTHAEEKTAGFPTTVQPEDMNPKEDDATTHSDIATASTKEDELITGMVKQDGTVEDQGNNRKPVNKTSEATTEDSTLTENHEQRKRIRKWSDKTDWKCN